MALYPINLNISGQLCVVIGAGTVAERKIAALLPCDARIRVISPELSAGVKQIVDANKLEWLPRPYRRGDLHGAALAFALTDRPEVQQQITAEARELGLPINVADNPKACTFQTAATVRRGDLLLSVSTSGGSPALAATIRKELASQFGREYGDLVKLLAMIRQPTVGQNSAQENQKQLLEQILKTNILDLLKRKEWRLLHEKLLEILPREINVDLLMQKMREQ
jgi:precorrin-2 dehydrogenase/sirohydrochlorin ferrochelatase